MPFNLGRPQDSQVLSGKYPVGYKPDGLSLITIMCMRASACVRVCVHICVCVTVLHVFIALKNNVCACILAFVHACLYMYVRGTLLFIAMKTV